MNASSQPRRLSWRELTDDQRWARIYSDRDRRAASLPRALPEARRLVAPVAVLLDATFEAKAIGVESRLDVWESLTVHVPKMTERLSVADRNALDQNVMAIIADVRRACPSVVAYFYAAAAAVAHLVDQSDFPPDSPGALAALAIKVELEETGADAFRGRGGTLQQGLASVGNVLDVYRAHRLIA